MASKKKKQRGKPVRLSNDVLNVLRPKMKKSESFDGVMRRLLGLRSRKGERQQLETYWVLTRPTLAVYKTKQEANGEAVMRAASQGKRKAEKPHKVMECI